MTTTLTGAGLLVVATRDGFLCREHRSTGEEFLWTDNPASLVSWVERAYIKVKTPGVSAAWVKHALSPTATLVVVGKWEGHDGGEVRTWGGSADELADAVANDYVRPFDRTAARAIIVCECGKKFITVRAWWQHRTTSSPGRGCAAA